MGRVLPASRSCLDLRIKPPFQSHSSDGQAKRLLGSVELAAKSTDLYSARGRKMSKINKTLSRLQKKAGGTVT